MFHRRALGRSRVGREAPGRRPVARDRDRRDRARDGRRHRRGGRGRRARASRRMGPPDRDRARAAPGETRRTGRLPRRRACPDRGARRRQAVEAGPRRRARAGPLHGVLRRRRRQGDGRNHPLPRRLYGLHVARASRRDRAYRAVELSDADRRAHRRRGAGDGQRLRAEAGGGSLPDLARARRSRARGGLSRTARSMSFRASARRPARRSPPTPASGIFPSPVRSRSGRWCRRRRRAMSRR